MSGLLLDTGVIVAIERGKITSLPDGDLAVAAITVVELMTGVELAKTPEERQHRQRALDAILALVKIEDYTRAIMPMHSKTRAFSQRSGNPRGDNDLMIAATAAATGRTLVSLDRKARFEDLPGVTVHLL